MSAACGPILLPDGFYYSLEGQINSSVACLLNFKELGRIERSDIRQLRYILSVVGYPSLDPYMDSSTLSLLRLISNGNDALYINISGYSAQSECYELILTVCPDGCTLSPIDLSAYIRCHRTNQGLKVLVLPILSSTVLLLRNFYESFFLFFNALSTNSSMRSSQSLTLLNA